MLLLEEYGPGLDSQFRTILKGAFHETSPDLVSEKFVE